MDLPWIEKYRPESLNDLISHDSIRSTITKFLDQDKLPHLLFYGPPGTGKTSTILAIAKKIYAKKELGSMILELNASDDRGIGVVREQILTFASTKTLFANTFKLIILDEADSMTKDAQNALRRIIEKYTENVRFCLICNYLSKVIPAIQSRCMRFRFAPISYKDVSPRLTQIASKENINLTEDGKKAIYRFASGDMRKALNLLQSASMSSSEINEKSVYACVAYPSPEEVRSLLECMLNEDINDAYNTILKVKTLKGIALQDILTEMQPLIMRMEIPEIIRGDLLIGLAEIEHRLSMGASETIQLGSLVATFGLAKEDLLSHT